MIIATCVTLGFLAVMAGWLALKGWSDVAMILAVVVFLALEILCLKTQSGVIAWLLPLVVPLVAYVSYTLTATIAERVRAARDPKRRRPNKP